MLGWLSLLIALYKLQAAGSGIFGRIVLTIQIVLFSIAALSNVFVLSGMNNQSSLFEFFDICWPAGNFLMVFTGLVIVFTGRLKGWQRFTAFYTGLIFPLTLLVSFLPGTEQNYLRHPYYYIVTFGLLSFLSMLTLALTILTSVKLRDGSIKNKADRSYSGRFKKLHV